MALDHIANANTGNISSAVMDTVLREGLRALGRDRLEDVLVTYILSKREYRKSNKPPVFDETRRVDFLSEYRSYVLAMERSALHKTREYIERERERANHGTQ